ncbi:MULTISPECIES: UPF0182 family protein [unclassified Corynebacterium]|uniref:UPF0182 family protein n=1 Tax=Corynebacterium TaxID=1716 RepID=UPI0025505E48|nr:MULTISPECIES: UPF0182 family protein [unclassified Corynebacterium]MDK8451920.1 UPF0182 family protein [Corynebacterium sp. MSK084]MDK8476041.1 UPF0182 family protein [Corynebacterium sp. MSK310]MDK8513856.1 UPF0182 family protein [Corynebacterium sp. MSK123]MDK8546768.1 UPF0182 family protein [Corynebacterium sp. MSK222]MDK8647140.1 UPF0182 family protein [Corynebacterium sp. MSK082]
MKRPPKVAAIIAAIIAVLLFFGPMLVGMYTDWRWFGSIDYRSVFTTAIIARIVLFIIFGLVAAAVVWAAGFFAWRGRPDSLDVGDLNSPVYQYRQSIEKSMGVLFEVIPAIVGIIAGFIGQSHWRDVMLFLNGQDFGVQDPQFHHDLGFYAFSLPVLQMVVNTLSILLVLAFLIALFGHYILGGIRIGNKAAGVRGSISRAARLQLAITAGLWMVAQVAGYWLERYGLLYSEHDLFTGGSYTDIHAYLPAKIILMIIGVFVAIALFMAIVIKDLRIPGLAVVLMLASSLIIGQAWPLLMERFSVQPNRQAKENESIARNIEATRYAYGLTDDHVTYKENWGGDNVSDDKVASDNATINNLRLLDPEILSPTFTQMQQLKNFYGFPETLSMDRYEIDGKMRDFVVAARELDPNELRENQSDWINRHTVYTHGNGFVAAQANTVDEVARDAGSARGGYPIFTVSDLQTQAGESEGEGETQDAEKSLGIKVDQPRIYYGPVIASAADNLDYAITGTTGENPVEYDTDSTNYTYDGEGGVEIGNLFDRTMYAAKYRELNFLLSDRVGSESKLLYDRDPRERVEKVAPWLTTDSATYPAVIDGHLKWIVDGYTTLDSLPYSQRASLSDATQDALNPDGTTQRLVNDRVGYIRNSVKATVDAYDGSVDLYEFDKEDPVLKAWEGVFPDVVKPESEISDELREHFRYPEDMFKVQRDLLARYHVDDPNVFFNNDAFWSVPNDPTAEESRDLNQPPYYVMAADPETGDPSFQLTTSYRGLNREFLSAHMAVSSDPDTYGDITVRVLPTNTQTQGPKQAQDAMMSSDQVARDRTLWEGTNDLHNGNLLALPVGGGEILYLEPIYSQRKDQASAFPKLLRVLVSYKGRVGYAPTIGDALEQVGIDAKSAQDIEEIEGDSGDDDADKDSSSADKKDEKKESTEESAPASAPRSSDEAGAIEDINKALKGLEDARNGSFEEYGRALDELDKAVESYQKSEG